MTDGRAAAREGRVTVVYCGGCNPHIDRAAIAAELPVDDPGARPGAAVHLSGCPRACASGHALVIAGDEARRAEALEGAPAIVVAGELVDGVPTSAPAIAAAVSRKLKE
jgi:hypothetical protein